MNLGKRLTWIALLWVILCRAWGADASLDQITFGGRDYVRLSDWAAAHKMKFQWTRGDAPIRLQNRWSSLTFSHESPKALINGVQVYLNHSIVTRGGVPHISTLDVETTLQPILSPPRNKAGIPIVHVFLDPGHGGRDPGNQGSGLMEKKYTLALANLVGDKLKRAGLDVSQSRHHDVSVDREDRPAMARRRGADLFVSLHFNAVESSKSEVRGCEVYCFTPAGAASTNSRNEGTEYRPSLGNKNNSKNLLLAYQVQKALVNNLNLEDRGVRRARFAVLREIDIPAILVEAGYLTHPTESRKIADPTYLNQVAQAITDGILDYKRFVER